LGATERLRYTVPVWPMASPPTAYSSSTDITTDTVGRGFVIGQTALLWTSETNFEVVTVDALSDTHITTHVPVVGTFPVGLAIVVPLMNAWLDPPTIDQRMQRAEAVPLVFREELPAVAGIDPSVGAAVTPTPASISVVQIKSGSPWAGRQFDDREVYIFDAAGQRILDPPLVWTVTQTGSIALPHPPVSLTFPQRGQQVHFDNGAVPGAAFSVRVDCGSLSATFGL
jgi:hypothetical protein